MKKFQEIVNKMIHVDYRKQAMDIINKSEKLNDPNLLIELENYYKEDKGNIFCIHLDFIKSKLIEKGFMDETENNF